MSWPHRLGQAQPEAAPGSQRRCFVLPQAHTMYQVGLMETDQHIEFFWGALEMFAQEELCKFIKFACNQERIPFTCPCKDGGPDTAHVPPYPMKIAPPDGTAGTALPWSCCKCLPLQFGAVPCVREGEQWTRNPTHQSPNVKEGKVRGHVPPGPDLHRAAVQARC